jgi:hypothetical protein
MRRRVMRCPSGVSSASRSIAPTSLPSGARNRSSPEVAEPGGGAGRGDERVDRERGRPEAEPPGEAVGEGDGPRPVRRFVGR